MDLVIGIVALVIFACALALGSLALTPKEREADKIVEEVSAEVAEHELGVPHELIERLEETD